MIVLEILKKEHKKYLLYDHMGIISGIKEDAPESTKKAYQELVELNKYSEENEIDF